MNRLAVLALLLLSCSPEFDPSIGQVSVDPVIVLPAPDDSPGATVEPGWYTAMCDQAYVETTTRGEGSCPGCYSFRKKAYYADLYLPGLAPYSPPNLIVLLCGRIDVGDYEEEGYGDQVETVGSPIPAGTCVQASAVIEFEHLYVDCGQTFEWLEPPDGFAPGWRWTEARVQLR